VICFQIKSDLPRIRGNISKSGRYSLIGGMIPNVTLDVHWGGNDLIIKWNIPRSEGMFPHLCDVSDIQWSIPQTGGYSQNYGMSSIMGYFLNLGMFLDTGGCSQIWGMFSDSNRRCSLNEVGCSCGYSPKWYQWNFLYIS